MLECPRCEWTVPESESFRRHAHEHDVPFPQGDAAEMPATSELFE